ncbi:PREDICTED: protein Shroom1 [Chinchilla lanigera]|uniref:protein Shroom1 n=1 Tax=Chinchilla lanigera TaxID=34839 RepID=UPI00069767A6|nr:PREDICTED: protein Shroom1 [Chinchilla lanigera]
MEEIRSAIIAQCGRVVLTTRLEAKAPSDAAPHDKAPDCSRSRHDPSWLQNDLEWMSWERAGTAQENTKTRKDRPQAASPQEKAVAEDSSRGTCGLSKGPFRNGTFLGGVGAHRVVLVGRSRRSFAKALNTSPGPERSWGEHGPLQEGLREKRSRSPGPRNSAPRGELRALGGPWGAQDWGKTTHEGRPHGELALALQPGPQVTLTQRLEPLGQGSPQPQPLAGLPRAPCSQDVRSPPASILAAMEALGPGGERTSPTASPRGLDLRRRSTGADSAYSSFSAASGGPERRTPSPGPEVPPHLDRDCARGVWAGLGPAPPDAALGTAQRPWPAVAAHSGPRPPALRESPGPLSRQATPLLYALAAEAEAGARAAEPPSPPASRAAYRQRLQGAQRRVLRETSFQRRELRMSLPARLRPAAPARLPTAHPRSASLSHPGGDCRVPAPGPAGRGRLASQQRKWCFSEPGKLDRVGQGGGPPGEALSETCASPGLAGPEPQELPHEARAVFRGPRETQPQSTVELDAGSEKLGNAQRPGRQRRSASGEALGPWRGPGGAMATVQVVPHGAETPRPLFLTTFSRFLPQKEAAVVCPAEVPRSSPAHCEQRVPETCLEPARLPSLPDDDVFLEEAPLDRMTPPPESCSVEGASASVHASDQSSGTGLGQRTGQATPPPERALHECPGTAGADVHWQGVNGSVGVSKPTSYGVPETANGDIPTTGSTGLLTPETPAGAEDDPLKPSPVDALGSSGSGTAGPPYHTSLAWGTGHLGSRPTWPSQRLEELAQELARLDPSLTDTLASEPSPEPALGLLDGLIPGTEVWATRRPACGEAGQEAAGSSEPGSPQFSFTQLLPASQETRPEDATVQPVPRQPCGVSIQAKKVELAGLLQEMLQDLRAKQDQLQGVAEAWARRRAALEAAVGQSCAPRELERFGRFLADLERVLGLLLLLGSRLARVHRALARVGPDGDPDERASLLQRLRLLQRQQEDAKELKEHVSRRERALREVLARALPAEEVRSYCTLLADKAAVLARQRSLDERVRLLQDQLDAVRSDLGHRPLSPRPSWPPRTCPPDKQPFSPPAT